MIIELVILLAIGIFAISYYLNNGENVYRFFAKGVTNAYDKYAPYSFKQVREKVKELGQEFTPREYVTQVVVFAVVAGGISYLYFYNLIIALIYAGVAVLFIPFLTYLRCQKVYSEYIFEQVQIYTTNVIMEFTTGFLR